VIGSGSAGTGGAGLTEDEKTAFQTAIEEIKGFSEPLAKEVENIFTTGSPADQKTWLKRNTPELTAAEKARWDTYVKGLGTDKERKAEQEAWDATSEAGKRYYLRFVEGGEEEVRAPTPARVVVRRSDGAPPVLPAIRRRTPPPAPTTGPLAGRVPVLPPIR